MQRPSFGWLRCYCWWTIVCCTVGHAAEWIFIISCQVHSFSKQLFTFLNIFPCRRVPSLSPLISFSVPAVDCRHLLLIQGSWCHQFWILFYQHLKVVSLHQFFDFSSLSDWLVILWPTQDYSRHIHSFSRPVLCGSHTLLISSRPVLWMFAESKNWQFSWKKPGMNQWFRVGSLTWLFGYFRALVKCQS